MPFPRLVLFARLVGGILNVHIPLVVPRKDLLKPFVLLGLADILSVQAESRTALLDHAYSAFE